MPAPSSIRPTTVLIATVLPSSTSTSFSTPADGRRNLGVHFVGRNLEQRLIALHVLAGLLQPLGQRAFHDTLAHLGHYDVNHENVSVNVGARNSKSEMLREISRQRRSHFVAARPSQPSSRIEVTGFVKPHGTMYWK